MTALEAEMIYFVPSQSSGHGMLARASRRGRKTIFVEGRKKETPS